MEEQTETHKKRILLLAYAVSPFRGSEYAVAWNYITQMSKDNELLVVYGTSGDHLGDIEELASYIKAFPLENVEFVSIEPTWGSRTLNAPNRIGFFTYSFYFAYYFWHREVYKAVKKIISDKHIDVIHYLVPIGFREPGYLWKLNRPYIWGPVGGTKNISFKLIKALTVSGKVKFGFKVLANYFQFHINPRLKKALNHSNVLITATTTDQNNFLTVHDKKSYYLPENGILETKFHENRIIQPGSKIKIIWIGRIDQNKALIILLESLLKMKNKSLVEVHIVGNGKLKNKQMKFSDENNLSGFITWHGAVPRPKVLELLSNSDLHVITSLSEANTTVLFEAMSCGVPTVSLDHCGMHDTICEKCGIKIDIHSYKQVTNDLASHLDQLVVNPFKINELSTGTRICSQNYTWESRRLFFNSMYDQAIENWKNMKMNK